MSPAKVTATRSPLSREVVADRALALADTEGLEAVTIRRLATELGVTPMALYWHFRTKDELLAGLGARVLDTVELGEPTGDWAVDLRAAMVALVVAMRPHPEAADLVAEQVLRHPVGLELTERALATISAAGFDPERTAYLTMQALRTVLVLVTGDPVDDLTVGDDALETHKREKLVALGSLSPERYPALRAHAEAMTYCRDVDLFFDLGIDHFVAGVKGLAPGA